MSVHEFTSIHSNIIRYADKHNYSLLEGKINQIAIKTNNYTKKKLFIFNSDKTETIPTFNVTYEKFIKPPIYKTFKIQLKQNGGEINKNKKTKKINEYFRYKTILTRCS